MLMAKRVVQFLWLLQSVIWLMATVQVDENLMEFVAEHHSLWVLCYGVIASLAVFERVLAFVHWCVGLLAEKFYGRRLVRIIRNLKPQDKYVLSRFITERKREIYLPAEDLSAEWLAASKIIVRTGSADEQSKTGYKLSIWAWDYLVRNPNLLA